MGFIEFDKEATKQTPTDDDVAHAKTLINNLQKNRMLTCKPSIETWANEFRLLRTTAKVTSTRVAAALEWLAANAKGQFTPKVFSAKSFRRKFHNIEAIMKRKADDGETKVEITNDAKTLAIPAAAHYIWPKGCATQLPEFIQRTINNRRALVVQLYKYKTDTDNDKQLRMLAEQVWLACNSPAGFVEQWCNIVNRNVVRWEDWGGNLVKLAFRADSKLAKNWGRSIAQEWSRDGLLYDKLLEVLE